MVMMMPRILVAFLRFTARMICCAKIEPALQSIYEARKHREMSQIMFLPLWLSLKLIQKWTVQLVEDSNLGPIWNLLLYVHRNMFYPYHLDGRQSTNSWCPKSFIKFYCNISILKKSQIMSTKIRNTENDQNIK